MGDFCVADGCGELASEVCFSCEGKKLFCTRHANDHMREKRSHDVQEFLIELKEEDAKGVCEIAVQALVNLAEGRKKLAGEVSSLVRLLYFEYGRAMDFYRNLEFNLVQTIRNVRKNVGKILKVDLALIKSITPSLFEQAIESPALPIVPKFSDRILKVSIDFYKQIYKSERFSYGLTPFEPLSNLYSSTRHESKFLREEQKKDESNLQLLCPNDLEIRIINLENLSTEAIYFKEIIPPRQGASAVQLEPGKWFYSFETQAYQLDIKHRVATILPNSRRKYYARGCVYHENSICLFGGVGGKNGEVNVKEAEQFSFVNKQWQELPLLPDIMKGTCAEVIDSKIFIVGFGCKSLLEYDSINRKYNELVKLNDAPRCKIILGDFVIVNKSNVIWQISNPSVTRIQLENEVVCDTLAVSTVAHTDKYVYFIIWDGVLMRFNKVTYAQEVIKYNP